jgi:ATP-binding cassette, subfamily F, member 3
LPDYSRSTPGLAGILASVIEVSGLTKTFGQRVLFRDAGLRVGARDRVAIVGPNGSGKTTLFEMILGMQDADAGRIAVAKGVALGYLPQETDALRGRTIVQEVLSAAPAAGDAGHRLEVLAHEISDETDEAERDRLLAEYARLQERFEALGGYSIESEARRICAGLGFRDSDLGRMTDALSGGWLMRVALAKLLLASPDTLLLDEPTNHLDVESVAWLERFLGVYEGAVLLVSHDRDFMNSFATKIVEIDRTKLVVYTGNYESFVEQREQKQAQLIAAAKQQGKRVAQLELFINRFRYKKSKAKQVQSKIRFIERMDRVEVTKEARRAMNLGFPQPPRPGRVVAALEGIDFSYGDTKVYSDLGVDVERGDKIALVGPNGAGKTTLLKLLAGVLTPSAGERRLGHNVSVGYFAQHQIEALNPANRVMQELGEAVPPGVQLKLRDLLGKFLFSGTDVDKPVAVLSGGERTRLALAKLLVQPFNFLCLDEPTNHLDITSRDILEDALEEYGGALVLITHDRHLIRSIANKIVEVVEGRVRSFPGDYEHYLWRLEQEALAAAPQAPERKRATKAASADDAAERRRAGAAARAESKRRRDAIRTVESDLEAAHARLGELSVLLGDPEFYAKGDAVAEVVREYEAVERRLKTLEADWERLATEADASG